MKKTLRLLLLSSACSGMALLSASTAQGQYQPQPWYLKVDAGGNVTTDTDLEEFFGPVAPGSKVKFDAGVRFGFEAGYFLTDWFALEGELGVMANNISSITDADTVDATYSNVPFLVNARFQWPHLGLVTPYLGGGVGGSIAILDANPINLNGTSLEGTMSTVVFAYQAFAGLRFRINESMGVGVEFRYFAVNSPSWEPEVTVGTASDQLKFGGTSTYAVSIAFDWRF